jgi:hypothetical protein
MPSSFAVRRPGCDPIGIQAVRDLGNRHRSSPLAHPVDVLLLRGGAIGLPAFAKGGALTEGLWHPYSGFRRFLEVGNVLPLGCGCPHSQSNAMLRLYDFFSESGYDFGRRGQKGCARLRARLGRGQEKRFLSGVGLAPVLVVLVIAFTMPSPVVRHSPLVCGASRRTNWPERHRVLTPDETGI